MLVYSVVLPFAVTVALLLVTGCLWPKHELAEPDELVRDTMSGASAMAFAVAYLVCHLGIHGAPAGAQLEAWEWLLLLVPLAAILGLVDSQAGGPTWWRLLSAILLAAATAWFIVPSFQDTPWIWRCGLGLTVVTLILFQLYVASKIPAGLVLLSWVLIGACGLPVLIASANAKFGFFSTSLSAAAGGAFLVYLLQGNLGRSLGSGPVSVATISLTSIFFSGYFNDYGDVPLAAFAAAATAPLGLVSGVVASRASPRVWILSAAAMLSVAAICATSLYLAWPALTAEPAY